MLKSFCFILALFATLSCKHQSGNETQRAQWDLVYVLFSEVSTDISFSGDSLIVNEQAQAVTEVPDENERNETFKRQKLEQSDYEFVKSFCDGITLLKGSYSFVPTENGNKFKADSSDNEGSFLNLLELSRSEPTRISDLKGHLITEISTVYRKISDFKRMSVRTLISFSDDGKRIKVLPRCQIERYSEY